MKKNIFFLFVIIPFYLFPQSFHPDKQPTQNLQYFKPDEKNIFAGDPMPFWHNDTFHVFWLTDYDHQFCCHDWAHMTTTDLIHWKHHPLAVPVDLPFEKTICTGSAIFANNKYYAFYATRTEKNDRTEYISFSTSQDGIHFTKQEPNQFITAPDAFETAHFRDPHLFFDEKSNQYYMIITTAYKKAQIDKNRYCLIYYTSKNLSDWQFQGPFYFPGSDEGFAYPECADLFKWNGWYYLLYKVTGGTFYRFAKSLNRDWITPEEDNIGNDYALVFKTARFKDNRRIAVGFVPSRQGNKDNGQWQYGGNLVFRELFQNPDGTLKTGIPPEMIPETKEKPVLKKEKIILSSTGKVGYNIFENIPANSHISCTVEPKSTNSSVGLLLRHTKKEHYELSFDAVARTVSLGNQTINRVKGLNKTFTLDIFMKNSIIDVCINGKRCIVNRCPEQKGTKLCFYVHNGKVVFKDIIVREVKD